MSLPSHDRRQWFKTQCEELSELLLEADLCEGTSADIGEFTFAIDFHDTQVFKMLELLRQVVPEDD